MFRQFKSFAELTDDFSTRNGTALRYVPSVADSDELPAGDAVCEVTWRELADMIREEAMDARASCAEIEVIRCSHSPETVVRVIAHVMAGCDVIMADPFMDGDALEKAMAEAAKAKRLRSRQRDSRGRLITGFSEGEILFFTSGTTSRSKMVRLTSASLCCSAWSGQCMLECGPDDVLLSLLPLSHVFGFVCSLLWGLAYGSVIALGRGVRHLTDDCAFFRPTILPTVPTLAGAMLRFDALNPELRVVLIGAAPCGSEVVDALRSRGINVYLGYGLTETSSGVAITQDQDEPDALYICPGADIHIEEDGEVTVATPCMMQGYIGDIPMFEGDRFCTGDIGYLDGHGRLHLKGRKKDVLIMADGTKIFCPEYEEDIAAACGFSDIGIVMKDGHAVLAAGEGADAAAIRAAVNDYNRRLARSQQIYDVIMPGRPLPRTASGKLRRYELAELV